MSHAEILLISYIKFCIEQRGKTIEFPLIVVCEELAKVALRDAESSVGADGVEFLEVFQRVKHAVLSSE